MKLKIANYRLQKKQRGYFLATILVFATVIIILTTSLIYISINQKKYFQANREKVSARQIAEAGINYYLWHLTHNNEDYADGHGDTCSPSCGPYSHDYRNAKGEIIGTYSLTITPPETGKNYVTIVSRGQLTGSPEVKILESRIGIPSFARYSLLSTDDLWFHPADKTYGRIHSNVGVRHQGEAFNDLVTASNETYYCTSESCGQQGWHPGVWCDDYPACSLLHGGYSFPVPLIDFSHITADLAQMKVESQADGQYYGASGGKGYHIVLEDTDYRLYRVTATKCGAQRTCNVYTQLGWQRVSDDIDTETLIGTYNFPNNGLVFTEDNLWIEGKINNDELTFAAARFPDTSSTNASIIINNNLLYTNYDGTDKIGLIAQKFITLPKVSPNYLEIDAAMISEHGTVEYHDYPQTIYERVKIHGAIATNGSHIFSWIAGGSEPVVVTSGYKETLLEYDEYMTFGPPPSFPTTGSYDILFWEEIP